MPIENKTRESQSEKPTVAVYTSTFLTASMTFIYRQLHGVADRFTPIVLTTKQDHKDRFPFSPIYIKEDNRTTECSRNFLIRVYRLLRRQITGKYAAAFSSSQILFWSDLIRRKDVRLIHAHFGPDGLRMLPIAEGLGLPLLVTFHGYDASSALHSRVYLRQLRQLFAYSHIICVSQNIANKLYLHGAVRSKTHTHHIGVPVEEFGVVERESIKNKVAQKKTLTFLQVSNFVEKKGHKYTAQAFHRFLPHYSKSQLIFAGDGPTRLQTEKLCQNLGLNGRVSFLGKVAKPQVIDLMRQADIFLHHSVTAKNGDQEGIPTVIMEAMATGLTVLSTRHSGIPELIEDGVDGYLVDERDINSYAERLASLVNGQPETGLRAAEKIRNQFNIDKQNKVLGDIYWSIIDGK
jgi:colanic acid/amylovoran biosynthesis glycosyltransferase